VAERTQTRQRILAQAGLCFDTIRIGQDPR
jgi:hypothetical protein